MKCENCNSEHNGGYGSGRFCSSKCARGFSTKAKRLDINDRVSLKLTKTPKQKSCIVCETMFMPVNRRNRICSDGCRTKLRINAGKKAYDTMISNGNHNGWKSRSGKLPSYPEQYFIDLFEAESLNDYEREFSEGKWFIDFAFLSKRIAIEIDGKQHNLPERKLKDDEKDTYLESKGWKVFRIKWFNPRTKSGRDKLYPQINEMKNLLRFA